MVQMHSLQLREEGPCLGPRLLPQVSNEPSQGVPGLSEVLGRTEVGGRPEVLVQRTGKHTGERPCGQRPKRAE